MFDILSRSKRAVLLLMVGCGGLVQLQAQHSVARMWSEAMLFSIRHDLARPTVHARNLWHGSMVMYDAWAVMDPVAETYLLGKTVNGQYCPFNGFPTPSDLDSARREAISYAAYRFIQFRFNNSPGNSQIIQYIDSLMNELGYDPSDLSWDYSTGSAAALGNYITFCAIDMGFDDGSNEIADYANQVYVPANVAMAPFAPGNANMTDPDHWQPLTFDVYIDQSGNVFPLSTPSFLSPEWGNVGGFALTDNDLIVYDTIWRVYHDPGPPPYLLQDVGRSNADAYRWGFELVAKWSSHLDPGDGVMWDISPAGIGGLTNYPDPNDLVAMQAFYDTHNGGDNSPGHTINPFTGLPYAPNMIPRGDYARVLAEFWADGPDSETPPGHWFVITNEVMDHPLFERRWGGSGPLMDPLEFDVKTYFTLGGAMHDAAIAAWSVKGWYDYPRPISTLRWMADNGQCTDTNIVAFDTLGINLDPGFIEMVLPGDPLEGDSLQHLGKVKFKAWLGPDSISDPDSSTAGVGWILAENWWPYQRPTFVTPPFAGYVSGHSTFSRSAAEVLTLITGDSYFPGGMGEFDAPAGQFLVFEDGPSMDVALQWATYRDASDQCSLSRIWGGIHPPCDDIPGRMMGMVIGPAAFDLAELYFAGTITSTDVEEVDPLDRSFVVYPMPLAEGIRQFFVRSEAMVQQALMFDAQGRMVNVQIDQLDLRHYKVGTDALNSGLYLLTLVTGDGVRTAKVLVSGSY